MEASEYAISWQEVTYLPDIAAAYQAPNRQQDFRAYFTTQGITLIPRQDASAWRLDLGLLGQSPPELAVETNRIDYQREDLEEWYVNSPGGLQHGFTFSQPTESGLLQVELSIGGSLSPALEAGGGQVSFSAADGQPVLQYGNLVVLDALGNMLPIRLELLNPTIVRLSVDSAGAAYPINLMALLTGLAPESPAEPAALPSSPSWSADPTNQLNSYFGWSASTAGDLNGDGYSEFMVGAYGFDGGETNEGKVFVYFGSVSGLSATPGWTAESNQAEAILGYFLAPAGDINGDGYYDLLLAAHGYDNPEVNEGRIFLWYGSAAGLGADGTPANADWSYETNNAGDLLGVSDGMAGDVNGDGFGDLIVGMYGYDNNETDEGAALAFYGSATGPGATPNWLVEQNQATAYFGFRVATAGDVNGDGFDDVIVGTEYYDHGEDNEGAVWVYHGSASGLSASANWFAESNQTASRFGGYSNNTAGDINGDGYSDVVVGAKQYDYACSSEEEGAVFVWLGSVAGLGDNGNPGNADWKGCGDSSGYQFGAAVSTAGDVNGDGYADLAVGCILCWIGADQGAIFLYYGSAGGLGATGTPNNADWTGKITAAGIDLGYAAGTAGDVNGDGYSDVFGGARFYDHEATDEGGAFVWYGSPDGLSTGGWRAESDQASAALGTCAVTAGDLNGDGYADVVIGASNYDKGEDNEGAVFVWFGSASGLGANGTPANATWMAESNQVGASFGYSCGTAGDVNGDGYDDLLVGAYLYDNGNADEGAAFAWYGSPTGLGAFGDPSNADWTAEGGQDTARFGHIVNRAGDVNGDGFSDVIVGAYQYDKGQADEGTAYVYHGSASGLSMTYNWMAESNQASSQFGVSASTAADVNGDGFSDVIVGAWGYNNGLSGEGMAFVWLGSASGLGANGTPANADWKAASGQQDANFGRAVSTAGDVNGDGYSDIIVGALYYDKVEFNEGAVFVWLGSATGLGADGTPANADWMAESNQPGSDFGLVVGNAGDVNGDGYTEVIVGARYYDNGQTDEGRVFVWYGSSSGLGANGTPANVDWSVESDQQNANMGYGPTGSAGDVNGDGYADVLVAVYNGGTSSEGIANLYNGNKGRGLAMTPQQMRSDGLAPVALLGASNSGTAIQLRLTGRMPLGRQRVKLEWQITPLGMAFTDASAIHGVSANWIDTGMSGATISQTIDGLTPFTSYHWRLRLLYFPNRMGQVASRWLHQPWHSFAEKDFFTPAAKIYLPICVR